MFIKALTSSPHWGYCPCIARNDHMHMKVTLLVKRGVALLVTQNAHVRNFKLSLLEVLTRGVTPLVTSMHCVLTSRQGFPS